MKKKILDTVDFKRIREVARKAIVAVFRSKNFVFDDQYDVEEVLSRTFLKVCKHLDQYDERVSRSAWFYTIAQRCALTYVYEAWDRSKHFVPLETACDDGDEGFVMNYADLSSDDTYMADYELLSSEKVGLVQHEITCLNGRACRAFTMLADGYSTEEVQDELDMKNGALRTMLSRGRAKLSESRVIRELYVETYGHEFRDIA